MPLDQFLVYPLELIPYVAITLVVALRCTSWRMHMLRIVLEIRQLKIKAD